MDLNIEESRIFTICRVVRKEDVAFCDVWNEDNSGGLIIWIIIVAVPIVFGPLLSSGLELISSLSKACSSSPYPATPSQAKYWALVILVGLLLLPCYAAHLWLVELYLRPLLGLDYFTSLTLKYYLGQLDVFLVPSLLVLLDGTLRRGLVTVCRMRRNVSAVNV